MSVVDLVCVCVRVCVLHISVTGYFKSKTTISMPLLRTVHKA